MRIRRLAVFFQLTNTHPVASFFLSLKQRISRRGTDSPPPSLTSSRQQPFRFQIPLTWRQMREEEEVADVKFRLYDGSDMGPFRYASTSTVDGLKQRILSDWPKGKTITPKAMNEVKLISSGKILDNNKTVGQCRMPYGEVAGGVIIMHVVVQPSLTKTKTAKKKVDHPPRRLVCSCSIL